MSGMTFRGALLGSAALALSGCSTIPVAGAFWGNLVVLGVTVGIFFGTLALGRNAPNRAEASTSSSTGGHGD